MDETSYSALKNKWLEHVEYFWPEKGWKIEDASPDLMRRFYQSSLLEKVKDCYYHGIRYLESQRLMSEAGEDQA